MAQIIVLTGEAKKVLQEMVFHRINELSDPQTEKQEQELGVLHKIYSDVVGTKR